MVLPSAPAASTCAALWHPSPVPPFGGGPWFNRPIATDPLTAATGTALAGLGVLHVAWGRGSSWPYPDRATLADEVIGQGFVPGPGPSFAVAGLLGTAAALVVGRPRRLGRLRVVGQAGVAAVLGTRAAFGFAGRTDLLVPDSGSDAFRRNDRRRFSPLCAALAIGAARAAVRTARAR